MEGLSAGRSVGESGSALYRSSGHERFELTEAPASNGVRTKSVTRNDEATNHDSRSADHGRPAPSADELRSLVDGLNQVFEAGKGIRFDISEDDGNIIVQVVDRRSDEVVRTIPPDRLAEVHRNLSEMASGSLLDDRA